MMSVLWQFSKTFPIILHETSGDILTFHSGTGQTHLLSSYSASIIAFLSSNAEPVSAEQLKLLDTQRFSELTLTELNKFLDSLHKLYLIEKISSI